MSLSCYTVKAVSELSKVTVKTLHHYDKLGLLVPSGRSEAGYRLYEDEELERLQSILFYRELDFSLKQIKELLDGEEDRLTILEQQEKLLLDRERRLDTIIETLRNAIRSRKKGEKMDTQEMFNGFQSEAEWREALKNQSNHLKGSYDYDMLEGTVIDVPEMNEMAAEGAAFMNGMAESLRMGVKHSDDGIMERIRAHLAFLNVNGHAITGEAFAAQTRYFLEDEFHLRMLEDQQTGLAYYLAAAAGVYAESRF